MLAPLPSHCRIITVIDGHPATLSWLGGVAGHRTVSLGVEHFGQTGTVTDLYRHYGIDAQSIAEIAANLTHGRPIYGIASVVVRIAIPIRSLLSRQSGQHWPNSFRKNAAELFGTIFRDTVLRFWPITGPSPPWMLFGLLASAEGNVDRHIATRECPIADSDSVDRHFIRVGAREFKRLEA